MPSEPTPTDAAVDDDAAARLERALERIALAAAQSMAARSAGEQPAPEIKEVMARLDTLIARLRAGLSDRS